MNDLKAGEYAPNDATSTPRAATFAHAMEMLSGLVAAAEAALILGAGAIAILRYGGFDGENVNPTLFLIALIAGAYHVVMRWASLNEVRALMRPLGALDDALVGLATAALFAGGMVFGFEVNTRFDTAAMLVFLLLAAAGVALFRLAVGAALRRLAARGVIGRAMVVLGAGPQSRRFLRTISNDPPHFTRVLGVFLIGETPDRDSVEGHQVLGGAEDLLAYARAGGIDDVVVALPWSADETVIETVEQLKELPINVYLGADLVGFDLKFQPVLGAFRRLPLFEVVQRPIFGWGWFLKAAFDCVAAAAALVILAPLFLIVAVAIKLDSPGPVFFMQPRLGFNNQAFSIYKFRSMRHGGAAEAKVRQATKGDPRITRVGRVIRAASIDELPQLFNVLNGTMSLVGPRPHALSHNEEYGAQIRGYFARHKVKPGITGWAQVNGLRGETTDLELMRRRVEHDTYYAENWSLLFDLRIILATLLVVLFQKNAY